MPSHILPTDSDKLRYLGSEWTWQRCWSISLQYCEVLPFFGLATTSKDFLSLVEAMHPCTFDRPDVHEDVLAAIIGLDESIPFWPLNHFTIPCAI
jgi:hypothetical protein